ncbi:MAG: aspartate dehydrogenase, partial [Thermoprotei archaeon]
MRRLAIIGCGAIGSLIARAVDEGVIEAELLYLLDLDRAKAERLASSLERQRPRVAGGIEEVVGDPRVEVVVEAASQEAVLQYGRMVLEAGKELVVLSVGALLTEEGRRLLEEHGDRIHVPSGAIAGLDALRALALAGVERVELVTRKHPSKLASSPYARERGLRLEGIREPVVVFEGPAEEAVRAFPRSLNVAAALAVYSRAPVHVRVVADPQALRNIHEIKVYSRASALYIRVENVPHPENPKTSY